jgi:hypothetical protein
MAYATLAVILSVFAGFTLSVVQGTADINPAPASLSLGLMLAAIFCNPILAFLDRMRPIRPDDRPSPNPSV